MSSQISISRATVEQIPHTPDDSPSNSPCSSLSSATGERKDYSSAPRIKKPSRLKRWSAKTKAVLHIRASPEPELDAPAPTLAPQPDDPDEDIRISDQIPDKTTFKDFMHNPINVVTNAVKSHSGNAMAEEVMNKEVSHGHDVELVNAHDAVESARTEEEKEEAQENYKQLERSRQDMFIRWALDRHVMKIKNFEPKAPTLMARRDFVTYDGDTGKEKMQWAKYAQHLLLRNAENYGNQYIGLYAEPGTPDKEALSAATERLIVSSAPYQELFVNLRKIYRWDNPTHTSMCLGVFLFLWACDFLVPALLLAIIVRVLQRYSITPSIEELRDQLTRIEDPDEAAMNLMEHIEKHGAKRWTETIVEQLGPRLMIKLGDIAGILEILMSFYEWRNPGRTSITLGMLATGFIFITVTPTWLLVKISTLSAGFCFFALFPISSRYWEYRYLVSPVTWLFWNIPSHPEWALGRLEFEGHQQKKLALQQILAKDSEKSNTSSTRDSGTGILPDQLRGIDLMKYACACKTHQGKLIIGNSDIRFETITRGKEMWRIPYARLRSVEKVQNSTRMRSGEDLHFTDMDGNVFTADDFMRRNEVFAQILGYSGIKWQIAG